MLLVRRILIVVILAPALATAQTPSAINPIEDAFVDSATSPTDRTNQNFGGAGALAVAGSAKANGQFSSVMRFDLSSSKSLFDTNYGIGNWSIQSATLRLTFATPNNAIFNNPSTAGSVNALWQVDDSWVEGTGSPMTPGATGITWNLLPTYVSGSDEAIGTLAVTGATSGSTTYPLSLTGGFVSDLSAGGLVSLRVEAGDPNVATLFNSRNFTTVSSRPVLTVTADVPEPTCGLAVAACALVIARRKRR